MIKPMSQVIANHDPYSHIVLKYWEILGSRLPHLRTTINKLTTLSAEVIKVEHPTRGDDTRAWGPPYAKYIEGSGKEGPGESAYFLAVEGLQPTMLHKLTTAGKSE